MFTARLFYVLFVCVYGIVTTLNVYALGIPTCFPTWFTHVSYMVTTCLLHGDTFTTRLLYSYVLRTACAFQCLFVVYW